MFLRRLGLVVLLIVLAVCAVYAEDDDNLLLSGVPIKYGEQRFLERIQERTNGEREPVGLVLSGGSARAFAHIGVLKYLEEQGIVPDFIISNSMGSIIALLYSAGFSPDQILKVCTEVNITGLFSLAMPINVGLLSSEKAKTYISSFVPEGTQIENLDIPVMIICEDLVTKRQIQIMEGPFADVLIASFAIPVYFSSVSYKNHLLIDGGTANLAPLDIAYQYAPFNFISTSFYNNTELNLKNAITALNVSIDIGKSRQGVSDILQHPDDSIWIRCDVEGFSFMEFSALGELVQRGYESAKTKMEEAKTIEVFSKIKHSGVSERMKQTRINMDEVISRQLKRYRYYNHVGSIGFNQALSVGGKSFAYMGDPFLLRDDTMVGITYGFQVGNWDASLLTGFAWQAFNFGPAIPAINFSQNFYLFPALKISTDLGYFLDFEVKNPEGKYSPVMHLTQSVSYIFPIIGKHRFSVMGVYELVNNYNSQVNRITVYNGLSHLATVSGKYSYEEREDLSAEVGLNMPFWKDYARQFVFTHLRASSTLNTSFLNLSCNLALRFCMDGKGNVPFFLSDGFRTKKADILLQGSPTPVENNQTNLLLGASMAFSIHPFGGKSFSIGELILLSDVYVQGYCGLLWNKFDSTIIPGISPGVEIHSNISLIGLKTMSTTVYLGFDGPSNAMIGGFYFSLAK